MSIKLMTRVWDETRFKGTELLILLCLADHANDEGICWPSYGKLALRARCSRRQAIRCLIRLKEEGWVAITGKKQARSGQWTNVYQLGIPSERSDKASPLVEDDEGGDIFGPRSDIFGKKEVTPMSPKPSVESSKEPPCGVEDLRI